MAYTDYISRRTPRFRLSALPPRTASINQGVRLAEIICWWAVACCITVAAGGHRIEDDERRRRAWSEESVMVEKMNLEERFNVIRSIGEECIQEDELRNLLANKPQPICYDGFEPSGRMHIAQGVMKTINVNKLVASGCKVKIWIADWFAQLNNKMGGDLKKIHVVGQYLIEIWKAAGMKVESGNVEFADICQLGMDQRKVNVLAREYAEDIKRKNKPIILSHHMLPGLQEGQEKMSKTDASSSIFMEDDEAEVNQKIKKAFCPPKVVEKNPCLEYLNYIIFPWFNEFTVERSQENGGNKTFISFEELVADYECGGLHPADLKPALSKALNKILQPVRDHFKNDANAKDLLKRVKSYKVTR
ncbi:hypothetical protein DM860_013762 [Cuscuta australis]|uniref:tyrosine--tRNA ligase n=1 Tax=Cuscuta australis TaxID=267555 RepID=A0A328DIT5_9ASTE|nr:hypothetical protein DM860_013762 [Cuscuta australis]